MKTRGVTGTLVLLEEMQNDTATLAMGLAVSYKDNICHMTKNTTPSIYPREMKT